MPTKQTTIDFLLTQLAGAGDISAKKMFGEYGLFLEGKMIAIVGDDQLFFKPTQRGRALFTTVKEAAPYPGAKPCFLVPKAKWSESEWMVQLAMCTADELPVPKAKKKKA